MTSLRVQCTDCDNMILPETARQNAGLCGQCVKLPASLRNERRVFRQRLASGALFQPDEQELASAGEPVEFRNGTDWFVDPESAGGGSDTSEHSTLHAATHALHLAAGAARGNVWLISSRGARLNLAFTENFAVCEYHDQDEGVFLYASTRDNVHRQVTAEEHVVQACPCCGVGLLWFPSRFHMPRRSGFNLVASILNKQPTPGVQWLAIGDITLTTKGMG